MEEESCGEDEEGSGTAAAQKVARVRSAFSARRIMVAGSWDVVDRESLDWWVGSSVAGGSCGSADERDTRRVKGGGVRHLCIDA